MTNNKKKLAIKLALDTKYKPKRGFGVYDNPVWKARKAGIAKRVAKSEANAKRASLLRSENKDEN
jgi:hypothetical protein